MALDTEDVSIRQPRSLEGSEISGYMCVDCVLLYGIESCGLFLQYLKKRHASRPCELVDETFPVCEAKLGCALVESLIFVHFLLQVPQAWGAAVSTQTTGTHSFITPGARRAPT